MIIDLSKNFNTSEMVVSKQYPEIVSKVKPKIVDILQAQVLALSCLQPIRDKFGPIIITSWLRDTILNSKVGGSIVSDHLYGAAADFISKEFKLIEIYNWIVQVSDIQYRQVIYYPDSFIHISCNHPRASIKREALVCEKKGVYTPYNIYFGAKS